MKKYRQSEFVKSAVNQRERDNKQSDVELTQNIEKWKYSIVI